MNEFERALESKTSEVEEMRSNLNVTRRSETHDALKEKDLRIKELFELIEELKKDISDKRKIIKELKKESDTREYAR